MARRTTNANQVRRLLALAEIYDGSSRSDAARIGGVGLQIVRDWVVRFNTRGPDGLINGKAPGRRPKLTDAQREALVAIVESGPIPEIHGVVRWRLIDLTQWLYKCSIPDDHIDPRRSALFMARSVLRDIQTGGTNARWFSGLCILA